MSAVVSEIDLAGSGLQIVVAEQGATTMITLEGECDIAQKDAFRDAVRRAFAFKPEHIVLDLSQLAFIDSTGIQVVIELSRSARQANVHLVICPGSQQVQRVFELCGLIKRLPFLPAGADQRPTTV